MCVMVALAGQTPSKANEILDKLIGYITKTIKLDATDFEFEKYVDIYDDNELQYMQTIENLTNSNK